MTPGGLQTERGPGRRRRLRGQLHPLPGRARCGRRASGRPPESRDLIRGRSRAARAAGDGRMATRARGRRYGGDNEGGGIP